MKVYRISVIISLQEKLKLVGHKCTRRGEKQAVKFPISLFFNLGFLSPPYFFGPFSLLRDFSPSSQISLLDYRSSDPGSSLGRGTALCSQAKHFVLTVPLFTQVYKWVLANLLLGVTLQWTSIPSRGE